MAPSAWEIRASSIRGRSANRTGAAGACAERGVSNSMTPATSFQQGVPSAFQSGGRYGMLRLTVSSACGLGTYPVSSLSISRGSVSMQVMRAPLTVEKETFHFRPPLALGPALKTRTSPASTSCSVRRFSKGKDFRNSTVT